MQDKQKAIIVGAGVFGLASALALLQRGYQVTVFDKSRVGAGASGGLVGALSPYVPEAWSVRKQFQLDALVSSQAYWRTIETLSGMSTGYGRIGRVIVLPDAYEAEKAKSRIAGAARHWRGEATWKLQQIHPLIDPQAAPFGVVVETLSARINPRAAAAALAKSIVKAGGDIVENCAVCGVKPQQVTFATGALVADIVVIAAGVHGLPLLEPYLGPKAVRGVKGQAAKLAIALPQHAPLINGQGIYIIPHATHVSVGSTSENNWENPDQTDHLLDEVLDKARAICPALRDAKIVERWAGLRPRAPKPEPMLGQLDTGVFVATGGFKTGLAVAHKISEALADMVGGQDPQIPLDFSPKHHFTKLRRRAGRQK